MAPRPQSTLLESTANDSPTEMITGDAMHTNTDNSNGLNYRKGKDLVVISGISGRFPDSDSVDEFAHNLFNKVDMITEDNRRWPTDLYEMNQRMGKLKEIDKFDGAFFGWRNRLGDSVDPQARIILETTYEAICDSGINPQTLRGSRTGVYVGNSTIGMPDGFPTVIDPTSRTSITEGMSWVQGTSKSMYANRVSFFFDFRGPSMTIDTACSSSMVALDIAVTDILCGKCDQAVVAGVNINMQAFTNYFYQKLGFNAPDGISKVWDVDADGFVRGETVASLFLQPERLSKRIYARILNSRTNIDGYKKTGMFFPSSDGQRDLLVDTYKEVNVDPNDITYFEAHGTGTKAGDFQEAYAIHRAYCTNGRTKPLPIGLLKSNIGHGEAASGVASITKVIISFENECIPANLNLKTIKPNIAELDLLMPITDSHSYAPGIAGVNSFGVGGVNGHALLEPNYRVCKSESNQITWSNLPRLVLLHGRTKEAVESLIDFIENNPSKITPDFLALIADVFKYKPMLNSAGFPFRATMLIKKDGSNTSNSLDYIKSDIESINIQFRNQLCFFYSGIGGQAAGMAKQFMHIEIFSSKLLQLASVLKPHGVNLVELLTSESCEATIQTSLTAKFVSTTAFQVIFTDILIKDLEVTPDVIVGHSFGEIAAAYAQGFISAEEAVLISYYRGVVLEQARKEIPSGLMAAVGMSYEEALDMCPKNVYVACNNAPKLVTISGEKKATKKFLEKLKSDGVFVRELDSAKYPLHTPYLEVVKEKLIKQLDTVFRATRGKKTKSMKEANLKWISTAQSQDYMDELYSNRADDSFSTRMSQYFLANLLNPVNLNGVLSRIPDSSIMLEVSGRELFEKVLVSAKPSLKYLPLLRANARVPETILSTLSALYRLGFNPAVERFYPAVKWPVARGTQSISSLLKWDHKETYFVKLYPEYCFKATASDLLLEIDPENPEFEYLYHHVIDGKHILPGSSMLFFAWKRYSDSMSKSWTKLPVQFEDVQLRRPIFLDKNQKVTLKVRLLDPTGEFVILEGSNVICTGVVKELKPNSFDHQEMLDKYDEMVGNMTTVSAEDIYKDFHVRGYEYGPKFKCIVDYSTDIKQHSFANVRWIGHMTAFLDNMLQLSAPVSPIKELIVPVIFPLVKCDPNVFFDAIEQNNISSTEVKNSTDNANVNELIGGVDDSEMNAEEVDEMRSKMSKITGEADQVKNADSIIRTYLNGDSRAIVAPGIEIHNFVGAYIGRKLHPQPVTTESHQFVPHNEAKTLQEEKELEVCEYEKLCAIECGQLLGQFKLNKLCSGVVNGFTTEVDKTVKELYCNAKNGNSLLKILTHSMEDLTNDPNNNTNKLMSQEVLFSEMEYFDNFAALLTESALRLANNGLKDKETIDKFLQRRYLLDFVYSDSIAALCQEERLIRPLVDIVAENFTFSKEFALLQLSPVQVHPLSLAVDKYFATSSVFKLAIDYTTAYPLADQTEEEIPFNFTNVSWNIQQDQLWPTNAKLKQQPHLIVLQDEPLLQELQLHMDDFWSALNKSLLHTGFVLILFRTKFTPVERLVYEAILKVKVPTERELQQRVELTKSKAAAISLLEVATKSDNFGHSAVLFRKNQMSEKLVHKKITFERDDDTWLQAMQDNLRLASTSEDERFWILANGDTLPGAMGFFNCIRKEPGGRLFRLLYLPEGSNQDAENLFEKHKQVLSELDLAVNIYKDQTFGTYRHLTCNLMSATRHSTEYHLNLGQRNELGSLALFDSTGLNQLTYVPELGAKLLRQKYAVYSSALNFRDAMLASGRIFPPIILLTQNCPIGTEFAGRDLETGSRVFGIAHGGSFASTVSVEPEYVRPIPEHWSYDDAVGSVTTYFSVWYGLIHKAKLEPGSTVLIHSAAGGVGQAAIHVCKAYGCTIFATAGSEEKRNFVHEKFQIPTEQIFSSRDNSFERGVRCLTNGKGVKYILNSLIGEQLDASLRLMADNGHFIELAKFEMQMNKKIGTFPFLRNLTYHGVAIEQPILKQKHVISEFFDWLLSNCGPNQAVQPLTTHIYSLENSVAAFRFMTSGKHKGKIIIRVREDDSEQEVSQIVPCKPLKVQTRTYFSPLKAYIVVGGCGGVGLELAHWLVRKGAKRIILTSRSAQRTPYQTVSLGCLNASGDHFPCYTNQISIYNKDISTEEGMRQLITETEQIAPIGGVFHLAVSLNDCLFENMTPDIWRKTVHSKATSGQLLDKLTREMCPNLDYFVCFSSVTAGRGNVGQGNYGYANSVLDQICERRRRDGLHGLALQYGPIGDVGLLSEMSDRTAFASVRLQRIISCLDVLNRAMQSDCAVVSSLVFTDRSQQENAVNGDSMLQHLWSALGVDPDTLPDHVTLGELGMESMFAVEMQQTLEAEFNIRLSLQEIKLITVGELKSSSKEKLQEQLKRVHEFKSYLLTVNLSLPATATEPLNSLTVGDPVFLLPSVLGIFGGMRVFAEKVNYPMIALNITPEVNAKYTCIKTAAEYYSGLLREMYPNIKRYNLVGFDYGAMVAMKMARKGFPSRVAVIDLKQTVKKNISSKDDKLCDYLIEFILDVLLAGTFNEVNADQKTKDRILRAVNVEVTLENKVKAIAGEIQRVSGSEKVNTEELEEVISGSLRRAQAMFEYDSKVSQKKDKLRNRLIGKLAKAQGRFLVIKDRNSTGLLTNYLLNDIVKNMGTDSPINLQQETLTLNSSADSLNKFFSSKAF